MAGGRHWLRKAAILLALGAGTLARSAPAPAPAPTGAPAWSADPDEQYILDVTIHQLRLGDTVRAYKAPEGTCVVLGDFLTALNLPIRIDLGAKAARGWAFKEPNRIAIDYAAGRVTYGPRQRRTHRARYHPRDARRLVRPGQRHCLAGSESGSNPSRRGRC